MSTLPSRTRRSGFTLVEVAIALAIFVFGALAIVQIFPPALGVIRNNEGRISATQLGETLLARTTGKPFSLPDAIYESDGTGNWLSTSDIPMSIVGTPSKNASLPASPLPSDFTSSALGHFKYISGERHTVRSDGMTKWVLLNHSAAPARVWVDQEEDIEGVQIDKDGRLNFRHATDSQGNSFTSTNASQVGNQPGNKGEDDGVTYYVSYKWIQGSSIHGVIDEPLYLYDRIWTGADGKVLQGILNSDNRIIPGNVKIRYRQRVGGTILSDDSATASGFYDVSNGKVLRGTLIVDLTVGKTYSFSYLVSDWRWMMDDRNAPSSAGVVQLPVKDLNQEPVGTLASVIGLETRFGDVAAPSIVSTLIPDYKKGTVLYPPSGPSTSGLRYRTVYRTLDGWAQQLSVAAKSYIPFYLTRPAESPREAHREYFWEGSGPGSENLYFHASEAGKSVLISYECSTEAGLRTVTNAVLTIDDDIVPQSVVPTTFAASGRVAQAVITGLEGNTAKVTAILSVQGLSVHARTAWQNADRYNQMIIPAYRTLMQ